MFAGVPFGHLADQRGPRGVAVWLHVGTGVTFGAILFVSWFPLFVVAVCLYLLMYRGGNAAKAALIVGVLDGPALVATRARIQAANNLGMSMGAAMAAIVLQIDTRSAYVSTLLFDALTFAVCGLFFLRLPKVARSAPRAAGEPRLRCCETARTLSSRSSTPSCSRTPRCSRSSCRCGSCCTPTRRAASSPPWS